MTRNKVPSTRRQTRRPLDRERSATKQPIGRFLIRSRKPVHWEATIPLTLSVQTIAAQYREASQSSTCLHDNRHKHGMSTRIYGWNAMGEYYRRRRHILQSTSHLIAARPLNSIFHPSSSWGFQMWLGRSILINWQHSATDCNNLIIMFFVFLKVPLTRRTAWQLL